MKLDARDFAALTRDASRFRAILIYGPDAGLVRERGEALARAAAGALDDPFRFTELTRPDPGTLALEASALSFSRRPPRGPGAGSGRYARGHAASGLPGDRRASLIILEAGELHAAVEAARLGGEGGAGRRPGLLRGGRRGAEGHAARPVRGGKGRRSLPRRWIGWPSMPVPTAA